MTERDRAILEVLAVAEHIYMTNDKFEYEGGKFLDLLFEKFGLNPEICLTTEALGSGTGPINVKAILPLSPGIEDEL